MAKGIGDCTILFEDPRKLLKKKDKIQDHGKVERMPMGTLVSEILEMGISH